MNLLLSVSVTQRAILLACLSTLLAAASTRAANWTGNGGDNDWSTVENWSDNTPPLSTTDAIFADLSTTTRDVASIVISAPGTTSARLLNFNNYGTGEDDWHVVQINAGSTLLATGSSTSFPFTIGGNVYGTPSQTTRVAFKGGGTLSIDKPTGTMRVMNSGNSDGFGYAELDLSELANFNATVANFDIAREGYSQGVLILAAKNHITATTVRVGDSGARGGVSAASPSQLLLGHENTFHVSDFNVAAASLGSGNPQKSSGTVEFFNQENGSSVIIRGQTGGATRANMAVGRSVEGSATIESPVGIADFRGGTVDALLDALIIGAGNNKGQVSMTGSFSMDRGTVDALTVSIGESGKDGAASAGFATGHLNIEGGTFTAGALSLAHNLVDAQRVAGNLNISGGSVEVTNGIVMGSVTNGTATEVNATIHLTGGSLTVGGDIARGGSQASITSTVHLRGGTLDMAGHALRVDHFNLEKGTLKNVGEFNAGGTLVKTTAGTLLLEGTHTYTGATDVEAGRVVLEGTLAGTSGVLVRSGAELSGRGSIRAAAGVTIESGGLLAFDHLAGTLSVGSLELQEGSSLSFALGGGNGGTDYGQLTSTGTVSLDGANLVLSLGFAPTVDQSFTLLINEGGAPIVGAFSSVNGVALGAGNTFSLEFEEEFYRFQLRYDGLGSESGGYDLVLHAMPIPEPASLAFLLFAGVGIATVVRRRRISRP